MESKDKATKQNLHVHVLLYEFYKQCKFMVLKKKTLYNKQDILHHPFMDHSLV